jgi:hypothetical protein
MKLSCDFVVLGLSLIVGYTVGIRPQEANSEHPCVVEPFSETETSTLDLIVSDSRPAEQAMSKF